MFEQLPLAAAAIIGALAARRALACFGPDCRCRRHAPPTLPARAAPASRPRPVEHPLFTFYRGAVRTSQELAARYLSADPGPLYLLAGVLWLLIAALAMLNGRQLSRPRLRPRVA